jgi:hypothetical protein
MIPEEKARAFGVQKLRTYLKRLRQRSQPQPMSPTEQDGEQQTTPELFRRVIVLFTNLANYALLKHGAPSVSHPTSLGSELTVRNLLSTPLAEHLAELAALRAKLGHGHTELTIEDVTGWVPARLDELDALAEVLAKVVSG